MVKLKQEHRPYLPFSLAYPAPFPQSAPLFTKLTQKHFATHYKPAYNEPVMEDYEQYLKRSLGFLLADVSRLLRQRFDARARELGLTRAQWRVLAQLRRREGITQAALADILEIEPITLARHIDRLEAKGFIERRQDPTDRRARNLHLLKPVRPLMDQMRKLSDLTRREALKGIPESESEKLIDLLLHIKGNLNTLDDTSSPKLETAAPSSPDLSSKRRPKS